MSNFSISHSVFKRLVLQTSKNQGLFGKGLRETIQNTFISKLCPFFNLDILSSIKHATAKRWHSHAVLLFNSESRLLMTLYKKPFENIVGKLENAGNQHFLLFPQCFLPFPIKTLTFESHLFCHLLMLSNRSSLEFCCLVKS